MPTVSDDAAFITFTDDEIAAFNAATPSEIAHLNQLIVAHARQQGGHVLAVWECLEGPRFGKNTKWSPNRIAAHLGIPQSRVQQICDDTLAAVWPTWKASPQYARLQARQR
jgi:hypothetical protein